MHALFVLSVWIHILAAATWIGGSLFLVIVLVPTTRELDGLIEDYIQEEIMYREAMAMGLDRDDAIIRRRLRQKMEFLSEDIAASIVPTDVDQPEHLSLSHNDAPFRIGGTGFPHYPRDDEEQAADGDEVE